MIAGSSKPTATDDVNDVIADVPSATSEQSDSVDKATTAKSPDSVDKATRRSKRGNIGKRKSDDNDVDIQFHVSPTKNSLEL